MARPSVEVERREQILEATCAVIADVGLQALRLSDVAKVAGMSSGTIHYYFDTKRELVNAAFAFNFSRSLERRQWILDVDKPPIETLRAIVDSYLPSDDKSLRAWHVWAELWAEGMRDVALQEVNERLYGQWRDVVADLIRSAQDQGLVRAGDPVEFANILVGTMDGLAIQVLLHSESMNLSEMRRTCNSFIDSLLSC